MVNTTSSAVPIQMSAWNINGYKSRIVNNKLTDPSFLREIENDDIISLVETHNSNIDDKLSIPGFKRVKVKNRASTSAKSGGGLACFAKEKISKSIIPINNDNKDVIWIKIKKDIFDKKRDIYIGTVYLTPYRNNNDSSKNVLDLFAEILAFQKKGEVLLQGDFNARTGVDDNTITIDKYDDEHMVPVENLVQNIPNRNSEDKVPADHRGKELLEMCKSLGLLILNGRKVGDLFGAYTSFQWNGSSVVDYVLAANSIYSSISYFRVGNYVPWLSDHCALRYRLDSSLEQDDITIQKKADKKLDKLFWGEESPGKFVSTLALHEQEISSILDSPDTDAQNVVGRFQNLVKAVIQEGNFKKKRSKPRDDAPWFDGACRKSREEVTAMGKDLQNCPNNLEMRKSLGKIKKKFRKLVREKKRSHAKNIFDSMLNFNTRNKSKEFWNSLKRLNTEVGVDYVSCISQQSWIEHFKKVRRTDIEPIYPPDFDEPGPMDYPITLEELGAVGGVLKNGKASGIDLISYEILKCIF